MLLLTNNLRIQELKYLKCHMNLYVLERVCIFIFERGNIRSRILPRSSDLQEIHDA